MRKFFYHSVSTLFFIFLVATAWSITTTLTFSKPYRLESWLSQSKLYDSFVATAIDQLQKPANTPSDHSTDNGLSLSLSDPNVQQAMKSAFSPAVIQNAVNTFLDANYNWLNGRTATPEFKIDLSGAKASLAANLGAYAEKRVSGLPLCPTTATSAPIVTSAPSDFDALKATCRPLGLLPLVAGQSVQQQIANSQDFLANPVITAQTLSKNKEQGNQQSQPYYEKLSQLPTVYRVATKLPWVLGVLVLLSGAGLVLLANTKRSGCKRVGTLLISSGVVILALILISGVAESAIEHRVFTDTTKGQLQKSLVDFAHRAQSALVKVDLWFGIGFLLAGVIIYLLIKFRWPAASKSDEPDTTAPLTPNPPTPTSKAPTLIQL